MFYLYRSCSFPSFYMPSRPGGRRGQRLAYNRFNPFWARCDQATTIQFDTVGTERSTPYIPNLVRKRCIGEFKEQVL
jgi:hypothetical protein